jgi:uncharacterized protein YlxP (DUF503 family)
MFSVIAAGQNTREKVEITGHTRILATDARSQKQPESRTRQMIVGVLTAHIHMHGITSLKQKRGIVKSLIGRLQSRFNVAVAEVDAHDNKSYAVIGMTTVANETGFVDRQLDTVISFMNKDGRFYLGQVERETFGA